VKTTKDPIEIGSKTGSKNKLQHSCERSKPSPTTPLEKTTEESDGHRRITQKTDVEWLER